ncbi:MAG: diguanylate cyclase [bacterium]
MQITKDDLEEKLNNLSLLYKKTEVFFSFLDIDELALEIVKKAKEFLGVEICSLMLKTDDALYIAAAIGLANDIIQQTKIKLGKGISGWVAKTGEPLLIKDIEKDKRVRKKHQSKYHTKSLLSVPLKKDNNVLGVLNLNNKKTKEIFNEDDLKLAAILANQASLAIDRIQLIQQEDEQKSMVKKRTQELNSLYHLGIRLSSSLNYIELIQILEEELHKIFYSPIILLMLFWEGIKKVIISSQYRITDTMIERVKNELTHKLSLFYDEEVNLDSFEFTIHQKGKILPVSKKELAQPMATSLLLPLVSADNVIGVISLGNNISQHPFTKEDLRLFNIIAHHGAVAIEQALLHKRVEELAITDGLTGLFNHRHFQECLDTEIKQSHRYGAPFSLIMLDIDDFKDYNDTYGHVEGDAALVKMAKVMEESLREVDIIARYGGEEFVVILPQTDNKAAYLAANRLRVAVKRTKFIQDSSLTISLGVATYPQHGAQKMELIRKVDEALYHAKSRGKNQVCIAA